MKLASWAICSPLLIAGVYANGFESTGGLPSCASKCLESSYGDSFSGTGINVTAICNGGNLDREVDTCISRECSGIERLRFAHVRGQMCDTKSDSRRNNHYVLLAAEIPAWLSPWLRVFSSWATCSRLSLDDHVMVICGLLYTVFATLVHLAWFVTSDLTDWDNAVQNVTDGLKIVYIAKVFELACLCLSRLAVLLVCLRIFPRNRHQIISYTAMAFTVIFTIVFIFLRIFQCSPIDFPWKGWTESSENGQCFNQQVLSHVAAGFDIAFNAALFIGLLLSVRRLSTGIGPRLIVTCMLALGVFALAVSCFRLWQMVDFAGKMKPVWDYRDRIIWMDVEVSSLVIVACLPNIWPSLTSVDSPSDREWRESHLESSHPSSSRAFSSRPPSNRPISSIRPISSNRPVSSSRPISSARPETGNSNSTETLRVKLKTSVTKLRQMSSFRNLIEKRSKKQTQSHLRLGDKIRGNVQTEIQGGQRFSMISQVGERIGIRVKTRTTTQVAVNRWDAEKGHVQETSEG
ncbi:CFEM domain-containing protein [Fusarium sp. LHS14.1]|nr:CFEM domain-containing protein [Fusarium sp. LHS14.1]